MEADSGPGLVYFEPKAYLLVRTVQTKHSNGNITCERTASSLVLPGPKKKLKFGRSWWGASEANVSFESGMIVTVGQKIDFKIPETLSAVAEIAAAAQGAELHSECTPGARLYPIDEMGTPSMNGMIEIPTNR